MQTKHRIVVSALLLGAGFAGLASPVHAQAAPAPATTAGAAPAPRSPVPVVTTTGTGDEVLQLSPFQVAADTDRGYQALNTLSGTRLNSKLEDLGASITVITKQQMQDTAVLDLNDVFLYEANTEGTGNYTQFTPNRNGGVIDGVAGDPATANRIRGVGSPISGSGVNLAIGNFSSNPRIPMDTYNIDSVEISRGPNSNLFGLGAAAGTVNLVQSKANLTRSTTTVTGRVDSEGGHRVSLDLSRPLIKDKLAFRFSTVEEEKGFTRKPAEETIKRFFFAAQARPFKNTTINASFERYDNFYRRPNSLTPRDTTLEWKAGGRPTFDPTTQMVTLANGTTSGPYPVTNENTLLPIGLMAGGYGRTTAVVDSTGVSFFTQTRTANPITTGVPTPYANNSNVRYIQTGTDIMRRKANPFPLFFAPATADKSLYDWESINYTAANYGEDTAKTFRIEAEQVLFNRGAHLVAARAGWFRQEFVRESYNYIDNTDSIIYVDINSKLLDGRSNPNFLRPYVEAVGPFANRNPDTRDTVNGDLAYQLTPSKELPRWLSWIGTQRLGAHLERNMNDTEAYTYGQWIADDHAWTNRANRVAVTQITQRYYVGDNQGQNVDYGPATLANINGNYNLTWFNNLTGQWVNEPTRVENLARPSTARNREELRTVSLTAQSYFLKDRLVTTVGWRRDKRRTRTSSAAAVNPATGLVTYDAYNTWGAWTEDATGPLGEATKASQRGDTKTYGVVAKPLAWLNLFYNRSDSFYPQVVRYAMDLKGVIPNAKGEGKDYGINFSALQGKLNVKVNRYEVAEKGSRAGEVGTIGNRTFRLEGRPENNGVRDNNGFYPWALNLSNSRFAAQGITPTAAQSASAVAKIMGVTDEWMSVFLSAGPGQPQTNGLSDIVSKGYEVEMTYNPTRNWRIKFTGAQQIAIDAAIGPEQFNYWQERLPVWTTARGDSVPGNGDGKGAPYWTTIPVLGGDTPETAYYNGLISPYLFSVANVGKPRTQVRKYRWNTVTNYTFTEGRLKNFNVGGAVRWEDKASIGFYGAAPSKLPGSFNGVILELDPNRPIYDKARYYFDLSAGYRFRLFNDKVRTNVQLNVRNAFEDGRLQPVAANPDGSIYAYRIIEPRRFILSASFDL
ncbi:TonB-dependent receptor plug domain-containing protein [Horticoccus sp. 23ND18S-11]|uniref:TonB-dependent receptor plug domain-containing protein n=1 Tax=Horticoccus sp. 23ND18S-11 TaxID=3391832 RepID=UPI0039C8D217